MKNKLNILVIMGGISSEREVSLKTGKEIANKLNKNKYNVKELVLNKKEDVFKIIEMKNEIDFVYIALHGAFGEDGTVQAILDAMDIKYSGPKMLASNICMDKNICKQLVKDYVQVIPGINMKQNSLISYQDAKEKFGEKLVLKQVNGGSSLGVFIVENEKEYNEAILEIFKLGDEIVLETFISGIEISVPIIGGKVYPTVQITPLKGSTFNFESKYSLDGAKEEVVIFPENIQKNINSMTQKIYELTKCSGFARIDYLIDKDNIVYMIEVNTLPGMTKTSLLPKSLAYLGYEYPEVLDILIENSMNEV